MLAITAVTVLVRPPDQALGQSSRDGRAAKQCKAGEADDTFGDRERIRTRSSGLAPDVVPVILRHAISLPS